MALLHPLPLHNSLGIVSTLVAGLCSGACLIAARWSEASTRRALLRLDPHLQADIGVEPRPVLVANRERRRP